MKNDLVQNIKDCGQSLIDNAARIARGYLCILRIYLLPVTRQKKMKLYT